MGRFWARHIPRFHTCCIKSLSSLLNTGLPRQASKQRGSGRPIAPSGRPVRSAALACRVPQAFGNKRIRGGCKRAKPEQNPAFKAGGIHQPAASVSFGNTFTRDMNSYTPRLIWVHSGDSQARSTLLRRSPGGSAPFALHARAFWLQHPPKRLEGTTNRKFAE